ncbi:MAG: phosphate starvation-inducible protein PhoH [Gammaproteobacteria bacterium]|nr:phosphate starvation-inducible protein PhoH [Gammaproteobacteria bacterium]
MNKVEIILEPADNTRLQNLCGPLNNNLKELELRFDVEINQRGNLFYFVGNKKNILIASETLKELYTEAEKKEISVDSLRNFLDQPDVLNSNKNNNKKNSENSLKYKNYIINISTDSQKNFVREINKNDLVFSVGAAGSGKTFLAIGAALHFYELGLVKKIVLVRPAVEAGESLGFLPGDLSQKIDPYLRPMYDALNTIVDTHLLNKMIEQNIIEVAPLAYMRGRTLNNSFIVLDEAQNSTKEQMKMFLTRLGKNSKAVITGDVTQIDLPNAFSGLVHVLPLINKIPGISVCKFTNIDVMRHPLVKKIIKAYEVKG